MATPFGGGGNKELITVTKDKDKRHLNTIGKSRLSEQDGTDIMILLSIAEGDPTVTLFVETLCSATFAKDGLSRAEQLMMMTGILATKSLPNASMDDERDERRGSKLPWNGKRNNGYYDEERVTNEV